MSCLGCYDENPLKERELEARRTKKQRVAIEKVARFMRSATSGVVFVEFSPSADSNPTKVHVSRGDRALEIKHRGMRITAECFDPSGVEAAFRCWAATQMTHARILPKELPTPKDNGGCNGTPVDL